MVIDNKDCHKDTNKGDPCTHEKGPTKASYEGSGVCVSRAFQYGRRGGGNDVKEGKPICLAGWQNLFDLLEAVCYTLCGSIVVVYTPFRCNFYCYHNKGGLAY